MLELANKSSKPPYSYLSCKPGTCELHNTRQCDSFLLLVGEVAAPQRAGAGASDRQRRQQPRPFRQGANHGAPDLRIPDRAGLRAERVGQCRALRLEELGGVTDPLAGAEHADSARDETRQSDQPVCAVHHRRQPSPAARGADG